MSVQDTKSAEGLLKFWFPPKDWDRHTNYSIEAKQLHVFGDLDIEEKYGPLIDKVRNNELEHWLNDDKGTLAYVLLCDSIYMKINADDETLCNERAVPIAKKVVAD